MDLFDKELEVLHYIRERYNEEQARFKTLEDKCAKLVTLLTVVIASFSAIIGFKSQTLLKPTCELEWIILLVCCFAIFFMSCSWGHALLALKIGDCPIAAKSRKHSEWLRDAEKQAVFKQLFECYVDPIDKLGIVIDKKADNLDYAYEELLIGAGLVSFFVILIFIKEVFL